MVRQILTPVSNLPDGVNIMKAGGCREAKSAAHSIHGPCTTTTGGCSIPHGSQLTFRGVACTNLEWVLCWKQDAPMVYATLYNGNKERE
jgi:hypothetical protein